MPFAHAGHARVRWRNGRAVLLPSRRWNQVSGMPKFDADASGLEGRYANYLQVGHNAFEVVFEFGQQYPHAAAAPTLHTRIITNPAYLKAFLVVLADALEAYQRSFGELPDTTE